MHLKLLLNAFFFVATAMAVDTVNELKRMNDQFSAHMFQELIKTHRDSSSVLSAFSVLPPLTQLALASEGQTHDEILTAIGLENNDIATEVFTDLNNNLLPSIKGVQLKQANKIYIGNDYTLDNQFAASTKEIFNSEVQNINFNEKEKAAKEINSWVEDQTNKRITNLIDPKNIDDQTVAVLVNAIYFQGNWTKPFQRSSTEDSTFHTTHGKKINIPMMYQSNKFKYKDSHALDAQIIEMEYKGGDASFIVVLPKKIDGVHKLITKLKDSTILNTAISTMTIHNVDLSLPKFRIETTTDLQAVLKNMNVISLFDPNEAKLPHLIKETKNLHVSSAIQKTYIDVNEVGTEAAAAAVPSHNSLSVTVPPPISDAEQIQRNTISIALRVLSVISIEMTIKVTGAYLPNVVSFEADHPFVFFLMVKNNILFNGVFLP